MSIHSNVNNAWQDAPPTFLKSSRRWVRRTCIAALIAGGVLIVCVLAWQGITANGNVLAASDVTGVIASECGMSDQRVPRPRAIDHLGIDCLVLPRAGGAGMVLLRGPRAFEAVNGAGQVFVTSA